MAPLLPASVRRGLRHLNVMARVTGPVVAELRAVEAEYHARSDPIDADAWLARPARRRLVQNVARLTSALQ